MRRLLRHLDEVVVPRLGRGFSRLTGRGRRRQITAGAGLLAAVGVIVVAVLATHQRTIEPGKAATTTTVHVGVAQGQSIPGYVATSQTELNSLASRVTPTDEVYALVSLRAYLAPDRLTPVLGGVTVAEVYTRVPLTRAQTQIVRIPAYRIPDDVASGMRQVAARKEGEAEQLRRLAAKLSEVNAAEDQLRDTYLGDAETAAAEAAAYRAACTCVYAAVIRANPSALEQIAARPEVRAVDPAPEVLRLDQAVFLAPLPEQQDVVMPTPPVSPTPVPAPSPSSLPTPKPDISGYPQSGSPSPPPASPSASPTRLIEPLR